MKHSEYCWMNAAYVMGARLTDAFAKTGFCVAIRGAEGGGKVENLPYHVFTSDDGDLDAKCPSEIGITDRREADPASTRLTANFGDWAQLAPTRTTSSSAGPFTRRHLSGVKGGSMERPSHIHFDTRRFSHRLPLIGLALSFQLATLWLFTHGLITGVVGNHG